MLSKENWKYLLNAAVVPEEMVKAEVGANWIEVLSFPQIPDYYKDFIRYFLIPFNISGMKFSFNKDYLEQHDTVRDHIDHPEFGKDFAHISPTLRSLLQDEIIIQSNYPTWFLAAFPDVAYWALQGEGLEIVSNSTNISKYINLDFKEISFENVALMAHIKAYLDTSTKRLECVWYYAP